LVAQRAVLARACTEADGDEAEEEVAADIDDGVEEEALRYARHHALSAGGEAVAHCRRASRTIVVAPSLLVR
jgi:hypothetical protein